MYLICISPAEDQFMYFFSLFDVFFFFFFKQKTAYEMRISDWSSDVCSSDLLADERPAMLEIRAGTGGDEAALFAGDLFRMYQRYAEERGWRVDRKSVV